jgi:hypothetical protein
MNQIKERKKFSNQSMQTLKGEKEQMLRNKKVWLIVAAGLTFFMAACQTVISISPVAAACFQAPPKLLENRLSLFIMGESATLILVIFSLYALSGAGRICRLPLLRVVLVTISSLFLLRGLFIVFTVLELLNILKGKILIQGVLSHLVFLAAGIAYTGGTILNWREMQRKKQL